MTNRRALLVAEIPHLRRYARALLRDREAADDLVQSALERALGRFHLWQPERKLRPWLFTIMHNIYVNMVRQGARRPNTISLVDIKTAPAIAPDQDRTMEALAILDAIDALPEDQCEVVTLVGLKELSYKEAAEVLGIPPGTLMSRLHRGRERLRQTLGLTERKPEIRRVK